MQTLLITLSLSAFHDPSSQVAAVWQEVPNPCPRAGARFGSDVTFLDFDGDAILDLAVGASGEGTVFVFQGDGVGGLTFHSVLTHSGTFSAVCNHPLPVESESFGFSLSAGQFDLLPGDELIVGAPAAQGEDGRLYMFGYSAGVWSLQSTFEPGTSGKAGRMGHSLAVGELAGSTLRPDIAAGAPNTSLGGSSTTNDGRVHVFVDGNPPDTELDNPFGAVNGYFGGHVAVGDVQQNFDSKLDLVVGAEANPHPTLPQQFGAVHVYFGPTLATSKDLFDPEPCRDSVTRFAKWVAARDGWVLTGAPQKAEMPLCTVPNDYVGGAFLFDYDQSAGDPPFFGQQLHDASNERLLGARCISADRIGDSVADHVYIDWGLGTAQKLWIWQGGNLGVFTSQASPSALHQTKHWVYGIDAAQLVPLGPEEIVIGASEYDVGSLDQAGGAWILF